MTEAPQTSPPDRPRIPSWAVALLAIGALIVVGLGVIVVVLLTRGSDGSSTAKDESADEPDTFTVEGTVTLTDSGVEHSGQECYGTGGYNDMVPGTQVVIRDADGTSVAVGDLGPGTVGDYNVVCEFDFTVEDVPSGSSVYSVEVSHRGEISFKEAQAQDLALTLG